MDGRKRRSANVPHDIVEVILVKVPVKSLVRLKAVSKEWRGTIESKCFIEKHMKSLGGGQARILTVSRSRCGRVGSLESQLIITSNNGIAHSSSSYQPIRPFRPSGFKVTNPCDGLLCIYNRGRRFNLVNPATSSRRILPDPISTVAEAGGHTGYSLLGIGREKSASRRYKLVWFFECDSKAVNKSTRCKVFALDSNTWRYVDPPNCRVYHEQPLIHLDGVLYCFSYTENSETSIIKLLAFDLHTETFQSFSVTPDIGSRYAHHIRMCVLNHRPCIFMKFVLGNDLFFKIWGLDINMNLWEIMYSIDISRLPPAFYNTGLMIPVGTINNYVILSNNDRAWVLYGSKTNTLRWTFPCRKYFMSFFETLVSVYQ